EEPRGDGGVVVDVEVVRDLEAEIVGIVVAEIVTALSLVHRPSRCRRPLVVAIAEEVALVCDIVLVVGIPLAEETARDREVLVCATEAERAVEVVVAELLYIPGASCVGTGI